MTKQEIQQTDSITIKLYTMCGIDQSIKGLCAQGKNPDKYSIFINDDMTQTWKLATFLHEMTHVYNHDFEGGSVQEIESRTHRQLIDALELLKQEADSF